MSECRLVDPPVSILLNRDAFEAQMGSHVWGRVCEQPLMVATRLAHRAVCSPDPP
jgi:hypothetical protein